MFVCVLKTLLLALPRQEEEFGDLEIQLFVNILGFAGGHFKQQRPFARQQS